MIARTDLIAAALMDMIESDRANGNLRLLIQDALGDGLTVRQADLDETVRTIAHAVRTTFPPVPYGWGSVDLPDALDAALASDPTPAYDPDQSMFYL